MRQPYLRRFAAFGTPAAMDAWCQRMATKLRVPPLNPVNRIDSATARVELAGGPAPADLPDLVDMVGADVQMVALWQDPTEARRWLHIHDGITQNLNVRAPMWTVNFMLADNGTFQIPGDTPPGSAVEAIACATSPFSSTAHTFITFDRDGLWRPASHEAPAGTIWARDALNVVPAALGRLLVTGGPFSYRPWQQWAVDALCAWFEQSDARACDVAGRIASCAGLPIEEMAPVLENRSEPASLVARMVHALAEQGLSCPQLAATLPAMLA